MVLGAAASSSALLSGCGDDSDHVVLYASADEFIVRQVVEKFEEETGLVVDVVGDTEASKTTGLVNRIRREADHPVADVFWSSECFMMIQLADEGLLQPHRSEATDGWPTLLCDPDGLWYGFAQRARVLAYSSERVADEDIPDQWIDIRLPRWRGRIVMADPRFGTTRGHLGVMKAFWDRNLPGGFEAFVEYLQESEIRMLSSGNAGVVHAIANGEADIGFTDTDDVWAAQRNGLKIDMVYPYHGLVGTRGDGTVLIPNSVAMVRGAPHSDEAARLIDFLLSADVERLLAESDSHNIPVRAAVAEEFGQYAVPDPLRVDLRDAAHEMDEAVRRVMAALDGDA